MEKTWKLKRVRQCDKCPWKVSTNPEDIPDGYCINKHADLAHTIAEPGILTFDAGLRAMACHEHPPGDEAYCVGWLVNQIGVGNNLMLRIKMMECENFGAVQIDGEQHEKFEDTLGEE